MVFDVGGVLGVTSKTEEKGLINVDGDLETDEASGRHFPRCARFGR